MGRKKRQFLEDDSDSDLSPASEEGLNYDENDPDVRAERELFERPYHKKRRRNEKEDAVYGIFAESDEDDYDSKHRVKQKRSDWTKAPAFVSGNKVDLKDVGNMEDGIESPRDAVDEEDEGGSSEDEQDDGDLAPRDDGSDASAEPSQPPSPRVHEGEELSAKPRFGGIGSAHAAAVGSFPSPSKGGIGSSKGSFGGGGIGFTKGSMSSMFAAAAMTTVATSAEPSIPAPSPSRPAADSTLTSSLPGSFGAATRTQRAFVRSGSSSTSKPSTPLPAHEQAHFSKIGSTIGAQMLAKMGWQTGTGLGVDGEGIVVPIESKLRPKNVGIAYKGFKEKTEQSKLEAKRRGEVVSEDEGLPPGIKKQERRTKEKHSDVWKKPRKVKTKVEHKTYEQIVAEAGQELSAPNLGQIIDATGRTPREVASLAEISVSSWTPSTDPTRLPEIRHNLRLIAENCKTELDGLAREAKALEDRKRVIAQEDARLRKKVAEEAELISRLQQVTLVVDDIGSKAKELASIYEATLDDFSPLFSQLLVNFSKEFDRYRLDEIVVAAIAPTVRRVVAQWNPLKNPSTLVSTFRTWKQALRINDVEQRPQNQVEVYGAPASAIPLPAVETSMTPFESLIWTVWLPKVRTCINNEWAPEDPTPAVKFYETWSSFLPLFVRDNILDQLILPKVIKAVADWSPKRSPVSLQALVFPWLPYLGLRVEDVLGDARRKVKSLLRGWVPADGVPKDLIVWREVFDAGEWDTMLLKFVVPKLASVLRDDFRVNPRAQDMQPLALVLPWSALLRRSIFSQLLETEFFPKWLDVLHIWLVQPRVSFEEVAQWYSFWKGSFSEEVQALPGVSRGFTRGLQLMNEAIELGVDAPTRLRRPDLRVELAAADGVQRTGTSKKVLTSHTQEITFRAIVEEFAAQHNLLFMPTGRAHEKSRMPLFKVSSTGGKGGLLVYVQDDAVWAQDGEDYRAITLEEMALRANK
ncbi:TFP11-domain-containing protein [Phlebopus sp. FC_14]|nr:TFP11-domain-containing protein [Phlebopus sp. FC_14]